MDVLGNSPGHIPTYSRGIREAGLWPQAERGGGKRSPHVQPHHLANLLICLGGHLPSEAVAALNALREVRRYPVPDDAYGPPGSLLAQQIEQERKNPLTLHGYLVWLIERAAADPGFLNYQFDGRWEGWELALCVNPVFAEVRVTEWSETGTPPRIVQGTQITPFRHHHQPPRLTPEPLRHVRRVAFLPPVAIETAAELWRDTVARAAGELASTSSVSAAATAGAAHENAPSPARDEAPIRDPAGQQTNPEHNAEHINADAGDARITLDSRNGREKSQARSKRGIGHGLLRSRSHSHEPSHPADRSSA